MSASVPAPTPASRDGCVLGQGHGDTPDLEQRLNFLNRGQAWVARRPEALIPRVEDAQVRADPGLDAYP